MKKRFLSALLCLCMVFGLVPATVWAATAGGHTHYLCCESNCSGVGGHTEKNGMTTFATEIKQANGKLYKGGEEWNFSNWYGNDCYYLDKKGTYYLSSNITLEFRIRIHANITLCLNGYTITSTNGDGADVITVHSTGTFTLTDCKGTNNVDRKSTRLNSSH